MDTVSVDSAQETDASLLLTIGAAGASSDDQRLATKAQRTFHKRYYGYVINILRRFAENVGTVVIDPDEFAIKTFQKAFKAAHTFEDRSNSAPAAAARQAKAWLGRIATNLAKDELDRISRVGSHFPVVPLEDNDAPEKAFDAVDALPTNPKALLALRGILDGLKPEEVDILMTYANFGEPTETGRELPREDREALEERTGYERSTIRKKWQRLSQRLRVELESFLPTSPNPAPPCLKKPPTKPPMN